MATTNDLEQRAKELRDKLLTKEDKTNLVAKAIIELVKEKEDLICPKNISFKIQDYFLLPYSSPYYIIYYQGNHISSVGYYIDKLYRDCFEKYNKLSIDFAVLNSTMPHFGDKCFDYLDELTKIKNKRNNDTEKHYRKQVVNAVCNGDYDFLLKPIPYLENCKEYKTYQVTKIINDEIDNRQDLTDEEKKQTKEYTYETRIPLEEKKDKVLNRANGKCEYCEDKEMTFEKENGENYLEIHHIKHYSDCKKEGIAPNTLDNLVALCPKCHKQIHFGKKEVIEKMKEILKRKLEK